MAYETPDGAAEESAPRLLLTVEEAAEALGLGRTSTFALIKAGHLESVMVGRLRCVPADAIPPYLRRLADEEPRPPRRKATRGDDVPPVTAEHNPGEAPHGADEAVTDPSSGPEKPQPSKAASKRRTRPEGTRAPDGAASIYFSEADGRWHGWVTVGIRDDGNPDRRHRMNKDEGKLRDAVRELLNQRDQGNVVRIGPDWTVKDWLLYWLEEIARPKLRWKAYAAYRSAVHVHLVPGLGAHKLRRIQPEHFERLYKKLGEKDLKPSTIHQVHRTARTAFGVALKRGYVQRNVVQLAEPPRLEETEVPALEIADMKAVIAAAMRRRGGVRYVLALVLGHRQGESLALEWAQLDRETMTIRVKDQIQRRTWQHGCDDPHACGARLHKTSRCPKDCKRHTRACPLPCPPDCAKHASLCPKRHGGGLVKAPVKSKAGDRQSGLPGTAFAMLMKHEEAQRKEREAAGTVWEEHGLMFCQPNGRPIDPSRDLAEWKAILVEAGLTEERLHAARHSFATLLGELEITDRTTQAIMGWSDASQAKRYQKVRDVILRSVADKVEGVIFTD